MDSILIYQAANDLVQNTGTRNIKRIARSCSLDILETPRFKDVLGFLSLHFDKPLILINRQLDKQTKQMVCGYALGHYLEHQLLMDLHTLNKFLTIKDKHILLYEHNAFTSHLIEHFSGELDLDIRPPLIRRKNSNRVEYNVHFSSYVGTFSIFPFIFRQKEKSHRPSDQ